VKKSVAVAVDGEDVKVLKREIEELKAKVQEEERLRRVAMESKDSSEKKVEEIQKLLDQERDVSKKYQLNVRELEAKVIKLFRHMRGMILLKIICR
jgi:phage shock protein A